MGAVAGPNIIVLMLTAMEHDLQARINMKMDSQMLLSMQSIFFGNAKAALYQQMQSCTPDSPQWKQIQVQVYQLECRERAIQTLEKTLDMEMKRLQAQLEMVQKRKEGAEKMRQKNTEDAFSYGHGR